MGNIARMPHPEGFDSENIKSSENSGQNMNEENNKANSNNLKSLIKYTPKLVGIPDTPKLQDIDAMGRST